LVTAWSEGESQNWKCGGNWTSNTFLILIWKIHSNTFQVNCKKLSYIRSFFMWWFLNKSESDNIDQIITVSKLIYHIKYFIESYFETRLICIHFITFTDWWFNQWSH
jgi:hypothetical protein